MFNPSINNKKPLLLVMNGLKYSSKEVIAKKKVGENQVKNQKFLNNAYDKCK
jgi:hypothetical protein